MSTRDCPCRGCTQETGRSPTCHHDGTCQRGHADWQREHNAEMAARRKAKRRQDDADGLLAQGALRTAKKKRR